MSSLVLEIVSKTKSMNLLYVEDNEEARRFTLELLSRFFDNICVAINGKEGFELFQTKKFDLIISDVNMPIMGGLDMAYLIRKIDRKIPIFILSAHTETHIKEAAENIDVTRYLTKPLNLAELTEILRHLINKD
ncbi:response regulator [bacterium]|nr:response regulator [bacterium]MBU1434868.1 response regulator [bacterium]MBU1503973.1 response regulator [bacterium]